MQVGLKGCSLTEPLLFTKIHTDRMIKHIFKGCVIIFIPSSFLQSLLYSVSEFSWFKELNLLPFALSSVLVEGETDHPARRVHAPLTPPEAKNTSLLISV